MVCWAAHAACFGRCRSPVAGRHLGKSGDYALVVLDNLTVSYRKHPALHHVSGHFAPGSLTAVVGPNGAGKSTLLKSIIALLPSSGGQIRVSAARTRMAYLPQRSELDPSFPINVQDCVLLGFWPSRGWLQGLTRYHLAQARAALQSVGLEGFGQRPIGTLSSGQLQRVLFARLLVQDADLILLDEPFTGLDQPSQDALREVFRELRKRGKLLLVSHHELSSVPEIFDRVVLLNGELIAAGTVAAAFTRENLTRAYGTRVFSRVSHGLAV